MLLFGLIMLLLGVLAFFAVIGLLVLLSLSSIDEGRSLPL